MKNEFKKWRKYLLERKADSQDRYEANFYLALDQSHDLDRTDLMNFMRAIDQVTTVYREEQISTSAKTFVGKYRFRFVLERGADSKNYYDTTLKPGLRKIRGLIIQRDLGYEKIEDV